MNAVRTFRLERDTDVSGVSGTGTVADGAVFPDGAVVMRWRGDRPSTVIYQAMHHLESVHGHNGATRVVYD